MSTWMHTIPRDEIEAVNEGHSHPHSHSHSQDTHWLASFVGRQTRSPLQMGMISTAKVCL